MPSGAGAQGAGATNGGYGASSAALAVNGRVTADPLGRPTSARKIDPRTGDYVVDIDGRMAGMTPGQQTVLLAVKSDLQSSAVQELGNQLRNIDRITENFQARVFSELQRCLQKAIDLGSVELRTFDTFKAGRNDGLPEGRTYGRLKWVDLTTGQEHTETI